MVRRLFGSWNAGLTAAGLADQIPRRLERRMWIREVIVDRIHEWQEAWGEPPRSRDWTREGARRRAGVRSGPAVEAELDSWPLTSVVIRTFGSWNAAIEAAELVGRPEGGDAAPWTQEAVIEALQAWKRDHGQAPSRSDWSSSSVDPHHPSARMVAKVFGTFTAAVKASGLVPKKYGRVGAMVEYVAANPGATAGDLATEFNASQASVRAQLGKCVDERLLVRRPSVSKTAPTEYEVAP